MNKKLLDIMSENNSSPLRKRKEYIQQVSEMEKFLGEYNIKVPQDKDFDFYKLELIYKSVVQKEYYENVFYENYIDMYDYWNDLSYDEKKTQMQPYVNEMEEKCLCFEFEGETIYIPILSIERNVFYRERLLMLQFKNHSKIVRDFEDEVQLNYYGSLPYEHGFSTLSLVSRRGELFSLYSEEIHALFFIDKSGDCYATMYLPKDKGEDRVVLEVISDYVFRDDALGCVEYLYAQEYGTKTILKKLKTLRKTLMKKEM